jgi:hypothetical protein
MGHLLTSLTLDISERDSRTLFSYAQGRYCSDASSGSSDKGDTPVKSSHALFSPFLLQSLCIQAVPMNPIQYTIRIAGKSGGRAITTHQGEDKPCP